MVQLSAGTHPGDGGYLELATLRAATTDMEGPGKVDRQGPGATGGTRLS